jgi:muramoyltetrapeptide carboxypeptidase
MRAVSGVYDSNFGVLQAIQMLKPGAKIAVVAPGGRVDPEKLSFPLSRLSSCGWEYVLGQHVYDQLRYYAGSRGARLTDLLWALTAPDIDAVWFARGGSGTAQLLSDIPWDSLDHRPVIGFSDATALHIPLFNAGIVSVHGPGLASLGADDQAVDEFSWNALRSLLCEGSDATLTGQLLCGPAQVARGNLIGGNLTVIASLAGTRYAMKADGAIVVLEDINEPTYKIERCLWQLIESGGLTGAVGIGFGELKGCGRNDENADWLKNAVQEMVEPLSVPVLWDLPIGHGKRNVAFRHGVAATLDPGVGIAVPG